MVGVLKRVTYQPHRFRFVGVADAPGLFRFSSGQDMSINYVKIDGTPDRHSDSPESLNRHTDFLGRKYSGDNNDFGKRDVMV